MGQCADFCFSEPEDEEDTLAGHWATRGELSAEQKSFDMDVPDERAVLSMPPSAAWSPPKAPIQMLSQPAMHTSASPTSAASGAAYLVNDGGGGGGAAGSGGGSGASAGAGAAAAAAAGAGPGSGSAGAAGEAAPT